MKIIKIFLNKCVHLPISNGFNYQVVELSSEWYLGVMICACVYKKKTVKAGNGDISCRNYSLFFVHSNLLFIFRCTFVSAVGIRAVYTLVQPEKCKPIFQSNIFLTEFFLLLHIFYLYSVCLFSLS